MRDRPVFMRQSMKVLNVFNTLTLIQVFWKTKSSFKKLDYYFLVKTTKIENTSFPFKTALSEANVKTIGMSPTKWTTDKQWSFGSNYFIFLEIFFQFQNILKRANLMYQRPKYSYSYFCKRWSLTLGCFFLLVSLRHYMFASKISCKISPFLFSFKIHYCDMPFCFEI